MALWHQPAVVGQLFSAQLQRRPKCLIWSSEYGNETYWNPQLVNLLSADKFEDAPMFYSLNGYAFANNPVFKMCLNENVIWYVYGKYIPKPQSFEIEYNGSSCF